MMSWLDGKAGKPPDACFHGEFFGDYAAWVAVFTWRRAIYLHEIALWLRLVINRNSEAVICQCQCAASTLILAGFIESSAHKAWTCEKKPS
ncbi:hypothetical protein Zmor_004597 [Zophobas morio]|uniref:Uncharacterized protein n=1 Tax=Zophobas morio TaxID=2755281 RepID=A0AA38MLF0_9CUCU|nr:hypothetical protein Zmor_004597 [Zophobas morio]